jgi:hypothetical protein
LNALQGTIKKLSTLQGTIKKKNALQGTIKKSALQGTNKRNAMSHEQPLLLNQCHKRMSRLHVKNDSESVSCIRSNFFNECKTACNFANHIRKQPILLADTYLPSPPLLTPTHPLTTHHTHAHPTLLHISHLQHRSKENGSGKAGRDGDGNQACPASLFNAHLHA